MFVARDDQTFDRRADQCFSTAAAMAAAALPAPTTIGAALGRRDFRQIGRQAKRRMRRAHGGVEHVAKKFAVVVGHGGFHG